MADQMNIFEFENYREFLRSYLSLEKNSSSGARKKLLSAVGISSSFLTQVLSETKQLSPDQAYEIALHIGLTEKETDYLLTLVDYSRAGSYKLKDRLMQKIRQLQQSSQQIEANVKSNITLTDEQKAIYYSSWIYTAVRNLIPTGQGPTTSAIAQKLGIPEARVENVIQFLVDIGLITKGDSGFEYRSGYTHLPPSHPLIFRHHQNWRQRAIHRMDHYNESQMFYTCPMAISKQTAMKMKAKLVEDIRTLNHSLSDEEPDVSFCLNIDFFEY